MFRSALNRCVAVVLAGCFSAGCSTPHPDWVRPDPREKWPAGSAEAHADAPWMVITCQYVKNGLAYASGSIVHSSPERGTWVLTAMHCVPRKDDPAWVWWIGPTGEELIEAEVAWPPQVDAEGKPRTWEVTEELMAIYTFVGDDFAFMKLKDGRTFPVAPLEAPDAADLKEGDEVELRAIAPHLHPHAMMWTWGAITADTDVFKPGHSGSAILRNGALTGILSHTIGASNLLSSNSVVRVRRMREVVKGTPLEPLLSR